MSGTTHVALLRGINVGGRTKVAMADLRDLFAALGHEDVTTYIQSGNVVFRSPGGDQSSLAAAIEARLAGDLGVPASVVLRTADELVSVLAGNPFLERVPDVSKLHVTFLVQPPAPDRADGLTIPAGETAELGLAGREVYLHCPDGYGRTKLNNTFLEKRLGVPATTRNWKTVTKLHELATA